MSGRIVEQQMEVVGAPESLDIELLGQGRMFRFNRAPQVKDGEPMIPVLGRHKELPSGWLYAGLMAFLSAIIVVFGLRG